MDKEITVVLAFLYAKPGKEQRVHEELKKVVTETRKEPGCLKFEAHQSRDNPTEFVVYENWRERTDVDKHIALPHVQHFLGLANEIFAKPVAVTFWKKME